jgi:hypothetical protein
MNKRSMKFDDGNSKSELETIKAKKKGTVPFKEDMGSLNSSAKKLIVQSKTGQNFNPDEDETDERKKRPKTKNFIPDETESDSIGERMRGGVSLI